ncbi:MAG TPA: TonB-dependent receptor [Terriglobales bacterium]|nr:TonB-dependent receptor [Terriglobales bacterium]
MRLKTTAVLLALVLLFAASAWSQEITGSIVGVVKDPTGAVIPNATVTITNTDKNVVIRSVTTSTGGDYVAPLLPIGHYSVSATAAGFKKVSHTGIELNVNDKLTINLILQVGGSTEEVSVEANPVQVELQSVAAAGLISGTQVRELSLNNRNYEQLVSLMPGVSSTASDQLYVGNFNPLGTNTVTFSINGQRTSSNNWTVDGADNVDRGSNLTLLTYPSVDAIAEFKVLRGLYNPEFGRAGAGQINVITKSGESSLHGGAYEFWRNDKLNANSYMNKHKAPSSWTPRPPLRYNNFGWTLGGPVYIPKVYEQKNKTFFFASQEFRRMIPFTPLFQGYVPTADERAGVLSGNPVGQVCVAFNPPATPGAAPTCAQTGTQITSINPVSKAYMDAIWSKMPLPNNTSVATQPHQLDQQLKNIYNYRQELIRIDHVFGPRLSVFGRYIKDTIPTTEPRGLFTGAALPGVSNTATDSPGKGWVFRSTASLTPNLLLEAGYSYSYGAIVSKVTGLASRENSPNINPLITLPYTATVSRIPAVTISGISSITGYGPYDDYNRNHNVFANLTKIAGKHTFKWGGSYYHYQKTENAAGNNTGTFAFTAMGAEAVLPADCYPTRRSTCTYTAQQISYVTTQQAWANFLLGNVTTFTQDSRDITPDVRAHQFEGYGQDEWRVLPNLTLNYGVRYSYFGQPWDEGDLLTNFDPTFYDPAKAPTIDPLTGNLVLTGSTANPNYDPLNGMVIAGKNSPWGRKITNENKSNFAPRLGLTWDPFGDGKTAIRTGYAMFYDTVLYGIVEQNIFRNKPFVNSVVIPNTSFANPGGGVASISAAPTSPRSYVSQPFHTPYSQQWSFDVQRELGHGMLFDIGYYGAKGTHLIGSVDINQPKVGEWRNHLTELGLTTGTTAIVSGTTARLNYIRPYKGYAAINAIRSMFNSNYNSLQMSFQKKFKGNSMVNVAYTWSKSLTDNQSDRDTPPQNTYDVAAEYGLSQQDRPHILTANFVYDLPFFASRKGVVGHVLGGWELSGIITYQAGTPLTVTGSSTGDTAGQGCLASSTLCAVRPDLIGDPNADAPHTFDQWFNTTAFADVPAGQYRPGTSGRGVVRGPGFGRWDLSLFKNFRLTERLRMQFRGEAFNVWNHTNFLGVDTSKSSATFGRITGTRDPRIVQLGLKLNF